MLWNRGVLDAIRSTDAIVAEAGMWGCTVARRLAEVGRKVLVLEMRAGGGSGRGAYRF